MKLRKDLLNQADEGIEPTLAWLFFFIGVGCSL
jgi:hypothetical protein